MGHDGSVREVATPASGEKMKIRLLFEERTFTIEMDSGATCRQLLNRACHMLYPGRVGVGRGVHGRRTN